MLPCVQAHLQVLGQNYIFTGVFVAVFPIQLPHFSPMGRAVFLTGTAVLLIGVIIGDGNDVDVQGSQQELGGMCFPF